MDVLSIDNDDTSIFNECSLSYTELHVHNTIVLDNNFMIFANDDLNHKVQIELMVI